MDNELGIEAPAYEKILVDEALAAASRALPGRQIVIAGASRGGPVACYDVNGPQVPLRGSDFASIYAMFTGDMRNVVISRVDGDLRETNCAVPASPGFAERFAAAFRSHWDGRDPGAEMRELRERPWYTTPHFEFSAEHARDCRLYEIARTALLTAAGMAELGTPVVIESDGREVEGRLVGRRRTTRTTPDGDESVLHWLVVEDGVRRHTVGSTALRSVGAAPDAAPVPGR